MKDIYAVLNELGITYEQYNHPAVFTVSEANKMDRKIPAGHSKNLFLRNKKGTQYYLIVISSHKQADLKNLSNLLEESRLSFASPEKLLEYLGLTPGSVSPFGLINDTDHAVQVIIDNDLLKNKKIAFHPNINTATLVISVDDLKKFLISMQNNIRYLIL